MLGKARREGSCEFVEIAFYHFVKVFAILKCDFFCCFKLVSG